MQKYYIVNVNFYVTAESEEQAKSDWMKLLCDPITEAYNDIDWYANFNIVKAEERTEIYKKIFMHPPTIGNMFKARDPKVWDQWAENYRELNANERPIREPAITYLEQ
jgi:hypothetical protein